MADELTVCLVIEGSYPYVTGGVSAWVQELMSALPEVRFQLFTISPKPGQEVRYTFPPNVIGHRDLVVNERPRQTAKLRGRRGLLEEIRRMHATFETDGAPELGELMRHLPPGSLLHDTAVDEGWDLVADGNRRHNPVHPFSEYFWSWKASHDLMFTILGAELPPADLYHAVSTGYAGLAAVAAKLRTNRPMLLTEHGLYHKEREMEIRRATFVRGYQRVLWTRTYYGISRLCYRHADLVVSLFEYNRRRQLELGAEADRTIVIPNGTDLERFRAVQRREREGFHVGLVGRVVPIKDIKTFILTCKIVADALPEARFWCIGPTDEDAAYAEDCRTLVASFQLGERFTFTGKVDVREYYSFLDVLLLTSVREAQPLVILEAWAAGVPVASTRVGNVPELLDHDERLLAASRDAEALARAVRWVHDRPAEVAGLVQANREKAGRFYDKRAVYRRYHELYRSLARRDD